jgi:hypothetical protein
MLRKKLLIIALLLFVPLFMKAQGYDLPKGEKVEKLKFELINNLVIIPVEINGTELTFILDSGVSKPILFNLSDSDSVPINNVTEITIRGLGDGEPMRALSSKNNRFSIGNAKNWAQDLYVVLHQPVHFSRHSGTWHYGI